MGELKLKTEESVDKEAAIGIVRAFVRLRDDGNMRALHYIADMAGGNEDLNSAYLEPPVDVQRVLRNACLIENWQDRDNEHSGPVTLLEDVAKVAKAALITDKNKPYDVRIAPALERLLSPQKPFPPMHI